MNMAQTSIKAIKSKSILRNNIGYGLKPLLDATGSAGLPAACCMLRVINNTDTTITLSYNGTDSNDLLLPMTSIEIYPQTNSQPNAREALFPVGFSVWVAGAPGMALGGVTLAGYYV